MMIDFDKVIKKAIDNTPILKAAGIKAIYGYPSDWNNYPIICYTSGSKTNYATDIAQNKARQYQIQYYIDIWLQGELGADYEKDIMESLEKAGFRTSSLGDMLDDVENNRHHIRLSAVSLYDVKNNTLY